MKEERLTDSRWKHTTNDEGGIKYRDPRHRLEQKDDRYKITKKAQCRPSVRTS